MKSLYRASLMGACCLALCSAVRAEDLFDQIGTLDKQAKTLTDEREILKSEAKKIEKEEDALKEEKANLGPEGPFFLITGQYSNTADIKGASESEAFGGARPTGQKFDTFAEAHANGEAHMSKNASKQPSYRIEDGSGAVLESDGMVNRKKLNQTGAASPEAKAKVAEHEAALAAEKQKFQTDLGAYQQKTAAFAQAVGSFQGDVGQLDADSLKNLLMKLLVSPQDLANSPSLTAANESVGKTVDDGSAAALVQKATGVGNPDTWQKGDPVKDNKDLKPGSAIATFGNDGKYPDGKGGHAAVFVKQDTGGVWVYDQYKTGGENPLQKPVAVRYLPFVGKPGASTSNSAGAYSAIMTGSK